MFKLFCNLTCEKPVLFIAPQIINVESNVEAFDYFSYLVTTLSSKIQNSCNSSVIIKFPDGITQKELLKKALKNKNYYSAVIVSPIKISEIAKEVIDHYHGGNTPPIFSIDKAIKSVNENVVPYVIADGNDGGKIAAEFFIRLFKYFEFKQGIPFKKPKPENPTISRFLIIKGLEGSEERVIGFSSVFSKNTSFACVCSKEVNFTRDGAFVEFLEQLKKVIPEYKKGDPLENVFFKGVFCCNDEMAIGVRDALVSLAYHLNTQPEIFSLLNAFSIDLDEFKEVILNTKVVGYDGINDVTYLIRRQDNFLYGTVSVKIDEQISYLTELINAFLDPKDHNPVVNLDPFKSQPCQIINQLSHELPAE
jgi:ABC-type sugar transport system substrate-binding protein